MVLPYAKLIRDRLLRHSNGAHNPNHPNAIGRNFAAPMLRPIERVIFAPSFRIHVGQVLFLRPRK
jgi:hypothetical protein